MLILQNTWHTAKKEEILTNFILTFYTQKTMKRNWKEAEAYVAPTIEVLEIAVEQGFAASPEEVPGMYQIDPWGDDDDDLKF